MQTNQNGELGSVAGSNEPVQNARSPLSLASIHTSFQDLQAWKSLCSFYSNGDVGRSECEHVWRRNWGTYVLNLPGAAREFERDGTIAAESPGRCILFSRVQ